METTTAAPPKEVSLLRTPLPVWLVAILMAVSFLAGFLLQNALPETTVDPAPAPATFEAPPLPLEFAPPLRDDQLDGELPDGHPPVGDAGGTDLEGDAAP